MAIKLEVLREKARVATREALRQCPAIPEHFRENLTLGVLFDDEARVFELYVARERPGDALVLTRVTANSKTGELSPVEVYPERWSTESTD
ncbi:hypothetical protein SAMN05443572_101411 [Myxococcus fulvus]|uniref:Lipoprotein n=1 Tax=Myxococcus fulvus TaxID=33 RepID=A0ABY1BW62_MYXFU|nr:hypothetical protein [Myxococcus fulvus]SES86517.1 hypothetical protein SAMN05443572_101411 [Myxococcus fulvus]